MEKASKKEKNVKERGEIHWEKEKLGEGDSKEGRKIKKYWKKRGGLKKEKENIQILNILFQY